ncbi:hypothetical protein M1446_00295 [Candidatus Dependentiae bacterium]|nr:hypothetical protein [Candidatus Dependentiae bacterium]
MNKYLLTVLTIFTANCVAMQVPANGYMNLATPFSANVSISPSTNGQNNKKKTFKELVHNLSIQTAKSVGYTVACGFFTAAARKMYSDYQSAATTSLSNLTSANIGNALKQASNSTFYGAAAIAATFFSYKYGYYAFRSLGSGISAFFIDIEEKPKK